ncbi:sialate O-acetylesterase [Lutibacter maritimus]|uniref:Sialate O-acetylesterase n=1 Tax=Lutibacter maritimus TaxID=593133 RepID=A0A1I6PPC5_9FLAO|nr:sialate O-acetylesterase [Lutibacter maritimus]SFS42057.1 sialate O-acetylesterase [Lutibacter maritimus]
MKYLLTLLVLFFSCTINSQTSLASIFGDNMVLQRNAGIPIWGWAKANEKIEVRFNKQIKKTKTNAHGKWMVTLNSEVAGGPYELVVIGKNTIKLSNILVGEVWLCSGQSNMEWTVGQSDNAEVEIKNAASYSNIRHIKIPKEISSLPNANFNNVSWDVCNSETISDFTGVGYFFAKQLYDSLQIPIGLINASWGGSNIETWISREGFESSNEFKNLIATLPKTNLDSLLKIKISGTQKRIEELQNEPFSNAKIETYKEVDLDDSSWLQMNEPEVWESQELGEFDGVIWLRKHVTLTKEDLNNTIILNIPAVDDDDTTYINGVKIGETKGWDQKRTYTINANILKEGDNVISIRVVDSSGSGGLYGDAVNFTLTIGEKELPLSGIWKYKVESIYNAVNFNDYPSLCFNAMINPIIPFGIKGVLWYQGETNVSRAYQYRTTFPLLIRDWRQKWDDKLLPFYYVQLATFNSEGDSNTGCDLAELREAQTKTLQLPNTGMVVTTDVGNPNDIHPRNKKTVGKRLASIALHNLYEKPMVHSGPKFKSMKINDDHIIVSFDDIGGGLMTTDLQGNVHGFEIAGKDQIFYKVNAVIEGDNIIISAKNINTPIHIRFSWIGDASASNLFNKEGFPAVPFRTDDWKTITTNVKYKF